MREYKLGILVSLMLLKCKVNNGFGRLGCKGGRGWILY